MDGDLMISFRNDFRMAYDNYQAGYLCPARRGLKTPHRGDWLVFDEKGKYLIDVMPEDLFQKTYEARKEESKGE